MASHDPVQLADPPTDMASKDASPEIYADPESGTDELESVGTTDIERVYRCPYLRLLTDYRLTAPGSWIGVSSQLSGCCISSAPQSGATLDWPRP